MITRIVKISKAIRKITRADIKKYLVDTLVAWFWSWILLQPFAIFIWGYTWDIWLSWTLTGIPIFLIIGRLLIWLILKSRKRLGVQD